MPPYSKTTWVDGSLPAIDASKLNKIEQGIFDSLRQDGSTTMSGQLVTTAGSAATPAIAPTGDSNTGIFFPAADTIAFGEGGAEAMRLTSSANVGIGTTSPTYKLHVNESDTAAGLSNFVGLTSSSGGVFAIGVSDKSLANPIWNITTGSNEQLAFLVGATEKVRITSAGNVGIGTTTPTALVSMHGSPQATSGAILTLRDTTATGANTTYGAITFLSSPGTDFSIGKASENANSALAFRNANTGAEFMRIASGGNVGIGTTSPLNSLQILKNQTSDTAILVSNVGTSSATTSMSFVLQESATPQGWLRRYRDGSGLTEIGYTNDLAFSGNVASTKTEHMRITSAGNVGIGVNPNVELHVKGTGEIFRLETTAATGDNFIRFYAPSATTKGFLGYTSSGSNNLVMNNVLSADVWIGTNNIDRLYVEAGGTTRPATNNTYDLGSSSFRWATIYAQNALNTSDARLKKDVAPSSLGLDFIASLNPVQYRWIEGGNTVDKVQTGTEAVEITPAIPAQPEVLDEEGNVIQEATQEVPAVTEEQPIYKEVVTPREGVRTHFGLIAQEVKAALPDGLDFAGWCLADKDDADSIQSLGYTQLIAPMIKAIQELKAEVEALKAQLNKR